MNRVSFFSYFDPCSSKHNALKNFTKLKIGERIAAVLAAIFAGFLSLPIGGMGIIAVFRGMVQHFTSSQVSAATKAALTSLKISTPPKQDTLAELKQRISNIDPVKKKFFSHAIHLYETSKHTALQPYRLKKNSFKLSSSHLPAYMKESFKPNSTELHFTKDFYDYQPHGSDYEEVWVNFANTRLGGRCFDPGFSLESTMVIEMPDLAEHIAAKQIQVGGKQICSIATRKRSYPNGYRPCPYLLKNVHRVQSLQEGKGWFYTMPLLKVQKLNILSISPPLIAFKTIDKQCDYKIAKDLFNTIMAGFTLVKENNPKESLIHSGKFGCGRYNHNATLVFLLQCLAAKQKGVHLMLHGYLDYELKKNFSTWKNLLPNLEGKPLIRCICIIADAVYKSGN